MRYTPFRACHFLYGIGLAVSALAEPIMGIGFTAKSINGEQDCRDDHAVA